MGRPGTSRDDDAERVRCRLALVIPGYAGWPVYIGLMPSAPRADDRLVVVAPTLLRAQLEPVIAVARIGERGQALQGVIDRVPRPVVDRDGIMSTLVSLFA